MSIKSNISALLWYKGKRSKSKWLIWDLVGCYHDRDTFEFKLGKVWSWNLWGRTPATRWLHSTVRWNVSSRDPYWNVCRICWNISRVTNNMLTNYTWYIVSSHRSFVFAKVSLLASCMINSYNLVSHIFLL